MQVRNIFQLYADIEHTSRNNAFYEKYNLRYSMGELLRRHPLPASPCQPLAPPTLTSVALSPSAPSP